MFRVRWFAVRANQPTNEYVHAVHSLGAAHYWAREQCACVRVFACKTLWCTTECQVPRGMLCVCVGVYRQNGAAIKLIITQRQLAAAGQLNAVRPGTSASGLEPITDALTLRPVK